MVAIAMKSFCRYVGPACVHACTLICSRVVSSFYNFG